jgi:hypothetical protein
MKNFTIILLFATLIPLQTFAQGLFSGYRQEKINVNVTQYPLNPLPEEFKTYNSKIYSGGIDFTYIRRVKPVAWVQTGNRNNYGSVELAEEEFLTLLGFERNITAPDLLIEMTLKNAEIKSKHMSSQKCTYIENKQRIESTCYNYLVTYTFGAALKVTDSEGNVIYEEVFHDPEANQKLILGWEGRDGIKGHWSTSYNSPYALEEGIQNEFYGKHIYDYIHSSLMSAARKINGDYATFDYTKEFLIAYERTTKRSNYDDLNKAVELMREAGMAITERKDKSEYFHKIDEAIGIWESALQEADFQERNARIDSKIAPQLYGNIAVASIWKHDWEKVYSIIEEGVKVVGGMLPSWKDLQNFALDMQKRHEANGISL